MLEARGRAGAPSGAGSCSGRPAAPSLPAARCRNGGGVETQTLLFACLFPLYGYA